VFVPVIAGVAVTVNVAVPLAAIDPGKVFTAKPVEPVTEVTVKAAVPVLFTVNENAEAAVPVVAVPTEIAGVLLVATAVVPFSTCRAGTGVAVPVTLTFSLNEGVVGSFVTIVIVPEFAPTVAGVPVIVNVAEAPAAIGLAGVTVPTANPVAPVTEVTVNEAVPVFLSVNVTAVAAVLTVAVPIEIAGELFGVTALPLFNTCNVGTGAAVPVTLTFSLKEGVVGSFVTMVIVPVLAPRAAGVPVTVNVAVAPAATEPGVVIALTMNPAEPVTDVTVKADVPVFLIENEVYAVAAVPVTADPTEIAGELLVVNPVVAFNTCRAGAVPVTLIFMTNEGVVGSFVTSVIVPVLVPVTAGVPVTVNVEEEPAAIGLGELRVPSTNPVEVVIDVTVRAEAPVFFTVNVNAVAAVPVREDPTEIAGVLFAAT